MQTKLHRTDDLLYAHGYTVAAAVAPSTVSPHINEQWQRHAASGGNVFYDDVTGAYYQAPKRLKRKHVGRYVA